MGDSPIIIAPTCLCNIPYRVAFLFQYPSHALACVAGHFEIAAAANLLVSRRTLHCHAAFPIRGGWLCPKCRGFETFGNGPLRVIGQTGFLPKKSHKKFTLEYQLD